MEIRAKTVLPLCLLLLCERQMMCGSPNAATLLQKWSEENKNLFRYHFHITILYYIIPFHKRIIKHFVSTKGLYEKGLTFSSLA